MTQRPQFCLVRQGAEFPVPLVYFKKWSERVTQVERDLRRSQSNLKFRAVSALTSAPAAHCFVQLGGFHSKDRDCKTPGNLFHCSSCLITKIFARPQQTILAALHWSHSSFSTSFFMLSDPKVDIAFQMQWNKCWVKKNYHFLWFVGMYSLLAGWTTFKIAKDAVDFNSVCLTFSLLPIRTWGLFQKSCQSGCTAAVALSISINPCWICSISINPCWISSSISRFIQLTEHIINFPQLGVIFKSDEEEPHLPLRSLIKVNCFQWHRCVVV